MKTQKEIEEIADKLYSEYAGYHKASFTSGYTRCQEDMANKQYTEEDMRNALNVGMSAEAGDYPKGWSFNSGISLEDYFINSLNKQD